MAGKTKVRPKNKKMHKDWKVTISGLVAVLLYFGNTGSDLEMFSSDCSMLIRVLGILAKFSDQSPNFSKVVPKIVVWKNAIFFEVALKLRSR